MKWSARQTFVSVKEAVSAKHNIFAWHTHLHCLSRLLMASVSQQLSNQTLHCMIPLQSVVSSVRYSVPPVLQMLVSQCGRLWKPSQANDNIKVHFCFCFCYFHHSPEHQAPTTPPITHHPIPASLRIQFPFSLFCHSNYRTCTPDREHDRLSASADWVAPGHRVE